MVAFLLATCAASLYGLPAADDPAFAVASIHRHAPGDEQFFVRPPGNGRFEATGSVARLLVMLAYDVQESQIVGGESWVGSEKWDVLAKSDDGGRHGNAETRRMLQNMLADRFGLRAHRETQERPAYVLTVARGGVKFKDSGKDGPMNLRVSSHSISLERGELSRMTQVLSGALGRPVVDRTGMAGRYDFDLQWDDAPVQGGSGIGLDVDAAPPGEEHGSIFTAIQRQLGLRLVSENVPVEVLKIDAIRRPSEN
jgi:uncharacterized protein (TIGR03435 family)